MPAFPEPECKMSDFNYLSAIAADASNLIKALQLVQSREGFVSDEAISRVADHFKLTPVEVEGVLTFYAQFKRTKPGRFQISLCDGTACHIKGANEVCAWVSRELGIAPGETDADGLFSLATVACLGCCSLAPVMSVNGTVYGRLDRKKVIAIIKEFRAK